MLSPEHLSRLSALLDQALDLAPEQRETWLSALQGEDASLADTLRRMLARHASAETAQWLADPSFTVPVATAGPPPEPFVAGQLIGAYRLLEPLGRGGMGEVWLAEPSSGPLKRQVALKLPLLAAHQSVLAQRLARERDILAALTHPHIARLYDAGFAEGGQPFLALEYVAGQPITVHCAERGLDARARVQLLLQVMQAVQYAHANLVIHRDLKPSNVLVTDEGRAMLLDFGIAKLLLPEHDLAEETELTQVGGRALTLAYAAPEQVSGAPVSTATDVWALGVLLYELIAQRQPFKREHPRETERAVMEIDPPAPCPDADLATITLKALKKAPTERYATVNAMAEDLQRWLNHEAVLARPDSAWYRTRKFVGRHKAGVTTAAAAVAVIIGASAVSIHQAQVAQAQTRIAQTEAQTARAVERFLEGILRSNSGDQADPLKARQRTAKELLDEGARRIATELDDAPQAKLKVLETLSDMFEDTEQVAEAVKLQDQRAQLAAKVDGPGSPTHVHALARKAHLLTTELKLEDAKSALEQALAAAASGTPDEEARITLYLAQAWYARHAEPGPGLEPVERALALLHKRPPSANLVHALSHQAALLIALDRGQEALAPLQEAAKLAKIDRIGTTSLLTSLLLMLAETRSDLRQMAEAESTYEEAILTARRYHGERSEILMSALLQSAQFLAIQGRTHSAMMRFSDAQGVHQSIAPSLHRDGLLMELVALAGRTAAKTGRLAEWQGLVDRAIDLTARQSIGPIFDVYLLLARAEFAYEQGQLGLAAQALDQAVAKQATISAAPPFLADDLMRARVKLALRQHRPDDAQAVLDAWLAARRASKAKDIQAVDGRMLACMISLQRPDAAASVQTCSDALTYARQAASACRCGRYEGDIGLLLGEAQARAGQAEASMASLRDATALIERDLGPEPAPLRLRAHTLLAQALLASGDAAAARAEAIAARAIVAEHARLAPEYTDALRELERSLARRSK